MKDFLTWPMIGGLAVLVVLIIVFALTVVTLRRAEMRKALGLPPDTKLGEAEKQMFQAFKDTDMKLVKTMRELPKARRYVMAREVLRRKGLLPDHSTKKDR